MINDMIATIKSIKKKIANPFDKTNLTPSLETIDFTPEERELLKDVNIEDWYVPHPENQSSKLSHAVIAGDHCINYNHPEGFAKIALLRGPDCDPLFQDDTIHRTDLRHRSGHDSRNSLTDLDKGRLVVERADQWTAENFQATGLLQRAKQDTDIFTAG